jgi:rhodanese-related sulfurtransferase
MATHVSVTEAAGLMQQGWRYLDVRSVPEFAAGHPAGALNVPLLHVEGGRMVPNPDFEAVIAATFRPDDNLLVGCKTAGRSAQAVALLEALGYLNLRLVRGGFSGERDPFGRVEAPGWVAAGLPVEQQATPGNSYADLSTRGRP